MRRLEILGGLALSTVSAIAAAVAAISSCQQTSATREDRTTPYKIAMFDTRTDEYRRFMSAGQRLDAAFRKALFVNPVYMETPADAMKQTDAQLEDANAKVAFMVDEYTTWLNEAQAVNVGWSPETTEAINSAVEASHNAMPCYLAFGPSARKNMPPTYWAGVRARAAEACPRTRPAVVAYDQALLNAYNLMQRHIRAVTLPDL